MNLRFNLFQNWDDLSMQLFFFIVETGQGLFIKYTVVPTRMDPWCLIHTDNIRGGILRNRESGERKKPPGDCVWRQFMSVGAFESHYTLRVLSAVLELVSVVAPVVLRGVGQALLTSRLVRGPGSTLEESSLTSLSYRVDSVLVETPRGGDGSVVVDSLAAVDAPVVVAVVVHVSVPVKHQTVLTRLMGQSPISAFIELVAVSFVRVSLNAIRLRAVALSEYSGQHGGSQH